MLDCEMTSENVRLITCGLNVRFGKSVIAPLPN